MNNPIAEAHPLPIERALLHNRVKLLPMQWIPAQKINLLSSFIQCLINIPAPLWLHCRLQSWMQIEPLFDAALCYKSWEEHPPWVHLLFSFFKKSWQILKNRTNTHSNKKPVQANDTTVMTVEHWPLLSAATRAQHCDTNETPIPNWKNTNILAGTRMLLIPVHFKLVLVQFTLGTEITVVAKL